MGLLRTVDPTNLVVTVEEAKRQVELPESSTHHDAYLEMLILGATRQVEQRTDRALISQTWQLTLDRFPAWEIYLPRPPLKSVTSIKYTDDDGVEQTVSASDYKVGTNSHPGRITPAYGQVWPTPRYEIEAVRILYVAGYGATRQTVPDDFKRAVLITVDHWFDPDQPIGTTDSADLPGAAQRLIESLHTGMKYGAYGVTK